MNVGEPLPRHSVYLLIYLCINGLPLTSVICRTASAVTLATCPCDSASDLADSCKADVALVAASISDWLASTCCRCASSVLVFSCVLAASSLAASSS